MAKKKAATGQKNTKPSKGGPKPATKAGKKLVAQKAKTQTYGDHEFEDLPTEPTVKFIPHSARVLFARAQEGIRELQARLDQAPGFKFADIGYKYTAGRCLNDIAVRIHVDKKIPKEAKAAGACTLLPKHCYYDRIPTDVIESVFHTGATEIDSGDEIKSNGTSVVGTLSMGVELAGTTANTNRMLLTCAHVIASQKPKVTDVFDVFDTHDSIIGRMNAFNRPFYDLSDEFDIAIFRAWKTIPMDQRGAFDNLQDGIRPKIVDDPDENDVTKKTKVYKYGAKTGWTEGIIDDVGPSVGDIPLEDGRFAKDHFLVVGLNGKFADQGDSGAPVISEDGRLMGIVRAVTKDSGVSRAVITRMTRIVARFRFQIPDLHA